MDFLVFGSIWSFIIGGIVIVSILSMLEDEDVNGWLLGLVIGVYLVLNYFFGNKDFFIDLLSWVKHNPVDVFMYVIGYFLLGVFWSIARWYFYVSDDLEKQKYNFDNLCGKTENDKFAPTLPSYSKNKDLIALWISYWPFSIIWNLTYKFFRRITILIRNKFEKVYTSISESLLNSYKK